MINRFIPERTPHELQERLKQIKNGRSRLAVPELRLLSRRTSFMVSGIVVAVLTGALIINYASEHRKKNLNSIDPVITRQISAFTPYYMKSDFKSDYRLVQGSVHYASGVLVFQIKNPAGKSMAFTEEATPPGYSIESLTYDKKYENNYGQAFITDAALRTTGALFTNDHTWILINSPTSIGADLIQQVLDALQPVSR